MSLFGKKEGGTGLGNLFRTAVSSAGAKVASTLGGTQVTKSPLTPTPIYSGTVPGTTWNDNPGNVLPVATVSNFTGQKDNTMLYVLAVIAAVFLFSKKR